MATPTNSPFIDSKEVAFFQDKVTNKVYNFPFNINTLNWNYQLNTQSYSTIGGRVTQILSVQITTMVIQGDAGSRKNILEMYSNYRAIQDSQTQYKIPANFSVPSRGLSFDVWLENFQIGYGVTTVAYPYTIAMEVHQDISNIAANATITDALARVVNNNGGEIGFSAAWTGLSSNEINIQFQDVVNALTGGILSSNSTSTLGG